MLEPVSPCHGLFCDVFLGRVVLFVAVGLRGLRGRTGLRALEGRVDRGHAGGGLMARHRGRSVVSCSQ